MLSEQPVYKKTVSLSRGTVLIEISVFAYLFWYKYTIFLVYFSIIQDLMFIKNIFWILALPMLAVGLTTLDNCTPEMKKSCSDFCSLTPGLMYCTKINESNVCTGRCNEEVNKVCSTLFSGMSRCEDGLIYCNCGRSSNLRNGCSTKQKSGTSLARCAQNWGWSCSPL